MNGVEEVTDLEQSVISRPLSEKQRRAEQKFYEALDICTAKLEDLRKLIHQHNADLIVNQHEIAEGALLQLTFVHLKLLARENSDMPVLVRNEDIPLEPAKRWESVSAKTALFSEQRYRQQSSASSDKEYSSFYLFCRNPIEALDISCEPPQLLDKTKGEINKLKTNTWVRRISIPVGMLVAVVTGLFNEAIKNTIKDGVKNVTSAVTSYFDDSNKPTASIQNDVSKEK